MHEHLDNRELTQFIVITAIFIIVGIALVAGYLFWFVPLWMHLVFVEKSFIATLAIPLCMLGLVIWHNHASHRW